jgi:hypothetical protein
MNSAAGGRRGGLTTFAAPTPATCRAQIITFPLAHRGTLVKQLAAKMAAAKSNETAERILQKRIAQLGRGLRTKKVTDVVITRQLRSLEAAVRTELWRVVLRFPTEERAP